MDPTFVNIFIRRAVLLARAQEERDKLEKHNHDLNELLLRKMRLKIERDEAHNARLRHETRVKYITDTLAVVLGILCIPICLVFIPVLIYIRAQSI